MTDAHLAAAMQAIEDAANGKYDAQLGVSPEHRDLLNRAKGDGQLSLGDIRNLNQAGEYELVDAAHEANRINLNQEN